MHHLFSLVSLSRFSSITLTAPALYLGLGWSSTYLLLEDHQQGGYSIYNQHVQHVDYHIVNKTDKAVSVRQKRLSWFNVLRLHVPLLEQTLTTLLNVITFWEKSNQSLFIYLFMHCKSSHNGQNMSEGRVGWHHLFTNVLFLTGLDNCSSVKVVN